MWFLYALASAIFASVRRTSEKQLSHKLNHFTIGWSVQLLALPVLFLALLFAGKWINPFDLGMNFWLPIILVWIGFYPINTFLYIQALKHGELSKILPLQSLGPVFSLFLAWALIGQQPSLSAAVAIGIIVLGVYVLNLKGAYLHNPFKIFTNDKANLYTLLCLVLVAVAGILDKIAIDASEPVYYSFVSTAGAVVTLFATAKIYKVKDTPKVKEYITPLGIAGTLFGLSYACYILALASGPLAYVSAVRSSSVLMGAFIGIVFLKEQLTAPKMAAFILITVGSVLLSTS